MRLNKIVLIFVAVTLSALSATHTQAQPFSEGFNVVPVPGWTTINTSSPAGTPGWTQGDPARFPSHTGAPNAYIAADRSSVTGTGTISKYLVTPMRRLRNGDVFKFWTRTVGGSSSPDRLQVSLGTISSCSSPGNFGTVVLDINPTLQIGGYPEAWTEFTVTVAGLPAPRNGCLAFRYFVDQGGTTGPNSNYIGIDTFSYTPVTPPSVHMPFDFDGDDKTEIGIYRQGSAEWWYERSSDSQIRSFQFGSSTDIITPGDFTGDGKSDIAIWRHADNRTYILRSEDSTFYSVNFGSSADTEVPVPADYDNDGKADVAFYRPHDNLWVFLFSAGGSTGFNWGSVGDKPLGGDFDGDGWSDPGVFRPSNGSWWIFRSGAGPLVVSFGSTADKPVPCDYTGDGKTDIAFWRPSTGQWFILRSEDLSYYAFPFGIGTDIPAPGDYDGDGKCDPTVFRPDGGVWYVGRSTGETLVTVFGTSGDRPIPNAYLP